ncbi:SGNH hydrolase-type esterase domain-containing protein [Artemisia annua]|uniref:SGNH hydrolase-type esterase domain-containing protein n=1 Tax=Artemisia annua TaxID=35608 RepID=A0A2U1NVM8_ARTAN|nr:SGNH hydrolase-type esterase domain-containing protein [Artemisia annua]
MTCYFSLLCHTMIVAVLMQFQIFVAVSQPQVPCYFIFGDSLVDNGNNNDLVTMAKANYPPYGIDFPEGVTGRFTNGRTIADIIGQLLGFSKFISSFANATDEDISTGVNYGSGGAGIRDESGSNLGGHISLNMQLQNHAAILSRLLLLQQNSTFTNEYVKKCIYLVNMGSNDYINNYLMPEKFPTSRIFTPDQYAAVLASQFSQQLTTLYQLGARNVAVFGVGLIGCTPAEIARFGTNGTCVESINNDVKLFNDRLKPLVDNINSNFSDARYTFINATGISTPQRGVALPNVPCCQLRSDGQCIPNSIPCANRSLFTFFDGFHPTEVANTVLATRSYNAQSPTDASPYDISQLAAISTDASQLAAI